MDARVKKCLDKIGEAFKELAASANSEAEALGLFLQIQQSGEAPIEKALTEGIEELKKREKEGNTDDQ